MNQIFLLQNQEKLFLNRQKEWVDGRDLGSLFKTPHRDEALNQLFEVNSKDFSQRIHIVACALKTNGLPDIDPADLPPPVVSAANIEEEDSTAADGGEFAAATDDEAEAAGI